MFSGIIQAVGKITAIQATGGDKRFSIDAATLSLQGAQLGASIAVNGACLTAIDLSASTFSADVSQETLNVTTLAGLRVGDVVNLERSLKLQDGVDGHLVTGHVDGVGEVIDIQPVGRSVELSVAYPADLGRYIARKGSIAVDGISLTVNAVHDDRFVVNIVPHTQAVTIIRGYAQGTKVNLEVDLFARYLERLVQTDRPGKISHQMLRDHGYA